MTPQASEAAPNKAEGALARIASAMAGASALFVVLVLVTGVYWLAQGLEDAMSDEVTPYPAIRTPTGILTLRRTTYKVSSESQTVVYWVEGFPPERLSRCAVRDRLNWQCRYSDGSAALYMVDGVLQQSPKSPAREDWIYISRWRWQYCSWTGRCLNEGLRN